MSSCEICKENFGTTKDGQVVDRYTMDNGRGMVVQVMTYGGIITSICVPNKKGNIGDVTLGFDTLKEYEAGHPYFGALIGRVANRTGRGRFTLDGESYQLAVNNPPNHLHGGIRGFDKHVWDAEVIDKVLHLSYTSQDGEENYPGEVKCMVSYEVTVNSELKINYTATTSKATPINLTNHAYFNLAGEGTENIYDHNIVMDADFYTPKDDTNISTGEIVHVTSTVFDLRSPGVKMGDNINNVPGDNGFDHNLCLSNHTGHLRWIARVEHHASGRVMEAFTDQPGVHFYTGNYVKNCKGKGGNLYGKHSAFCLETQNFPDAINKPHFPNSVLRPGETYKHSTVYKFSTLS